MPVGLCPCQSASMAATHTVVISRPSGGHIPSHKYTVINPGPQFPKRPDLFICMDVSSSDSKRLAQLPREMSSCHGLVPAPWAGCVLPLSRWQVDGNVTLTGT